MTLPAIAEKLSRTEPGNTVSGRDAATETPGLFGNLLTEVRDRSPAERDEDRDTPPAGTEALVQPQAHVTVTGRPSGTASATAADSDSAGSVQPGEATGEQAFSVSLDSGATSALNPEAFAATLDALNTTTPPDTLSPDLATRLPAAVDPVPTGGTPIQTATTSAATPVTPEWTITPPTQSAAFAPALGQSIHWMVKEQLQVARLQLNPENLGPVEVRITVTGDRTDIQFAVGGPEARAAIQDALPQLRTALENSGLALGQASVNEDSRRQAAPFAFPPGADRERQTGDNTGTPLESTRPRGLVDLYA